MMDKRCDALHFDRHHRLRASVWFMEALDLTKNEAGTQMEAEDETTAVETPANTSMAEASA